MKNGMALFGCSVLVLLNFGVCATPLSIEHGSSSVDHDTVASRPSEAVTADRAAIARCVKKKSQRDESE